MYAKFLRLWLKNKLGLSIIEVWTWIGKRKNNYYLLSLVNLIMELNLFKLTGRRLWVFHFLMFQTKMLFQYYKNFLLIYTRWHKSLNCLLEFKYGSAKN